MFAYFDCASGISGDMTLGALLDLGADLAAVQGGLDSMGLSQVRLSTAEVKKKGFRALHLRIEHPEERAHRHLHHVEAMITKSGEITSRKELGDGHFHKNRPGRSQGPRHVAPSGALP
ncbi:MAG: DUF111 family protein [Pirellulales bacterium]